ncbi:uncharacterized protein LOC123550320 [Mercenaria mercenaria]|uniref:uncharacterized protein LOC123550320 n=1 Tax=Mercenaria mercenaria TaxID=6596 RepID=UPI00234EB1B0|nr:uncharacterized protein LOC123550320 [Mercenaria mercenaria]XP_053401066.1 uncharacterized protein LOC123550320 [Mercenaria mercenaria]
MLLISSEFEQMSTRIRLYFHYTSSLEAYPRLYYFDGRFRDLLQRFKRILSPLPKDVHDEHLLLDANKLSDILKNGFNIIIVGKGDLTPDDLFVSVQNVEDSKRIPTTSCITVFICYVKVDDLEQTVAEEIVQTIEYLKETGRDRDEFADSFIIACKTSKSASDEEILRFREEIRLKAEVTLGCVLDTDNVIISTGECDIKHRISYIYERCIIELLIRIRSFLGLFVKKRRQIEQNQTCILHQTPVLSAILGFLRNRFYLSDISYLKHNRKSFLNQVIPRLARHVRCTIITLVSSKYTLPTWLCTRLLNVTEFEDVLIKSVSNKTRYVLGKLEHTNVSKHMEIQNVKNGVLELESKVLNPSNCFTFDFILLFLQRDFEDASSNAEKKISSMRKVSITMSKMIYEIDGYLKQTIVKHDKFPHKDSTVTIPTSLRHNILAMKGVYGMGTIYGVIEIHLLVDKDSLDKALLDRLELLMREIHLQNSYRIKHIKH